jgi:hypothetical protein
MRVELDTVRLRTSIPPAAAVQAALADKTPPPRITGLAALARPPALPARRLRTLAVVAAAGTATTVLAAQAVQVVAARVVIAAVMRPPGPRILAAAAAVAQRDVAVMLPTLPDLVVLAS